MAVTLSIGELALELRISVTDNDADIPTHYVPLLQRGLDTATALIEQRAQRGAGRHPKQPPHQCSLGIDFGLRTSRTISRRAELRGMYSWGG